MLLLNLLVLSVRYAGLAFAAGLPQCLCCGCSASCHVCQ